MTDQLERLLELVEQESEDESPEGESNKTEPEGKHRKKTA